jgi:hypothetical protein
MQHHECKYGTVLEREMSRREERKRRMTWTYTVSMYGDGIKKSTKNS